MAAALLALVAAGLMNVSCSGSTPPLAKDAGAGGAGGTTGRDAANDAPPLDRPGDLPAANPDTGMGTGKVEGSACGTGTDCASSFCFDGVCCRTDCSASCWSCSSQGSVGICIPADVGTDPRSECPDDGIASCGRDGTCDGAGACRKYPTGTVCKAQSCASATETLASTCDSGVCKPKSGLPCDPFACNADGSACLTACATNADCNGTNVCVAGSCGPKAAGAPCGADAECKSNICQQGVCCTTTCAANCFSCAVPQSEGLCTAVPAGSDPLGQCADNGAMSCGTDGTCDGKGGCRDYVSGTVCSASTCLAGTAMETVGGRCDGAGTCAAGAALSCNQYACDTANGVCLTKCAKDADCATGNVCNGTICGKKVVGTACGSGAECDSTFCQQGVCCDKSCSGTCQACNLPNKGGTCTSVPVGMDPLGQCPAATATNSCGNAGGCNGAGKCALIASGTTCQMPTCTGSTETLSGRCDGAGNCTAGMTQACDPYECGTAGTCLSTCTADAQCTVGSCLSMSCGKKPPGAPCTAGSDCGSTFCQQGFCCLTTCTGTCMSCGISGSQGSCVNITAGLPPFVATQCTDNGAPSCGTDGTCDGAGMCRKYASGKQCMAASCAGATFTGAGTCNGMGTCQIPTAGACPGGYKCDNTNPTSPVCKITCAADTDCVSPLVCNGGVCGPKPLGKACMTNSECAAGFCQQGVCCSSACTGTCMSCALPGATTLGTCSPIAAGGADPAGGCATTVALTCGTDGTCDGTGKCRKYPLGTQCVAASCTGSLQTPARTCDGAGNCQTVTSGQCTPYQCGTTGACKNSCTPATTTTDCVSPNVCTGTSCGKRPTGSACTANSDCNSTFCAQGFCCLTACTGLCQSCGLTASLGTCAAVAPGGTDPGGRCTNQGQPSCGTDGTCNGSGACRFYATGSVCLAASCASTGSTLTAAKVCNGSGACQVPTPATTPCPGGFACNAAGTACKTTCALPAPTPPDCVTPNVCTGTICGVLKVQYQAHNATPTTNTLTPWFQLVNLGTTAVPLSQLTIRYWYTADGAQGQTAVIDYAANSANMQIQPDMSGTFTAVTRTGADYYVQFAFTAAAGNLNPNGGITIVEPRIFSSNFATVYTQAGDYSYDATKTAFADWTHVTLYNNGNLVWGIEPPAM